MLKVQINRELKLPQFMHFPIFSVLVNKSYSLLIQEFICAQFIHIFSADLPNSTKWLKIISNFENKQKVLGPLKKIPVVCKRMQEGIFYERKLPLILGHPVFSGFCSANVC
jgi:hypothetical protein